MNQFYKLHFDVDNHGIPLPALVTSASVHDSQAAIPLEMMTNSRVSSLYSLVDAAHNSELIEKIVKAAGRRFVRVRGHEQIAFRN